MQYISDFLDGTKDKDGNDLTTGFKGATKLGYRAAIYAFLDSKYGSVRKKKDSTPQEREQYERLAAKVMKSKFVPLVELKKYKDYLIERKRPPHSISQGVTCVRIWFEHYDHGLSSKDIRELKKHMPTQRHGVTREGELNTEIIQNILSHTGDIRLKAAILLSLSTGLRIGEICKLTPADIDTNKNLIYVSDLASKTGMDRRVFFTDEAKEALSIYMAERDAYIERAKTLTPRLKQEHKESKMIFPVTEAALRDSLISALKRAKLYEVDPRTNRTNIHFHSFRKYFSSTLKLAGMPEDLVEYFMGHANGLSMAYRTYSTSQLLEQYKKFDFSLHVDYSFTVQKELRSQVEEHNGIIKSLERERDELKERLAQVEAREREREQIKSIADIAISDKKLDAMINKKIEIKMNAMIGKMGK